MYIDTITRELMERDVAAYLDVPAEELIQYIDYAANKAKEDRWSFNTDPFNSELDAIFFDLQPENSIDKILVYHLARRLPYIQDSCDGDNLQHLLTSENALTQFLAEHRVNFSTRQNHPILIYKGKEVSLEDTSDTDVCYLRSRFGFNFGREDYCFNGFVLRDLLMKNSYARELYYGPEFLTVLSRFLGNKSIQEDYFSQSRYFCFTYLVPFDMVIFDGHDELKGSMKENHFLHQVCYRLLSYLDTRPEYLYDHDNPIVRFDDDAMVPAKYLIKKEEIFLEMLQ